MEFTGELARDLGRHFKKGLIMFNGWGRRFPSPPEIVAARRSIDVPTASRVAVHHKNPKLTTCLHGFGFFWSPGSWSIRALYQK